MVNEFHWNWNGKPIIELFSRITLSPFSLELRHHHSMTNLKEFSKESDRDSKDNDINMRSAVLSL